MSGSWSNPPEPTIRIRSERISMHDERSRRRALPAPDHRGAGPGRRSLDMIWLPRVERGMEQPFIVEIAVAAIDWQSW